MARQADSYTRFLILAITFAVVLNLHHLLFVTQRPASDPRRVQANEPESGSLGKLAGRDKHEGAAAAQPAAVQAAPAGHSNNPKSSASSSAYPTVRGGGRLLDNLFRVQGNFKFPEFNETTMLAIYPNEVPASYPVRARDRIWNQMRYVPVNAATGKSRTKTILLYNGLGGEGNGRERFQRDNCPVSDCIMTGDRSQAATADVIMWQHSVFNPFHKRPAKQIWAVYFLESPHHTPSLNGFAGKVNWTATYRSDSVIVAPYYKFTPYVHNVFVKTQTKNYASGKTKKVAWFVSNCGAQNGRLEYARELGKHIQVDIYGGCGTHQCSRSRSGECFRLLEKEYKFYLAFENSNCWNYITEKFFLNGLSHDILPIVMGARMQDYIDVAPLNSFLHVDNFTSPKHLADYLHELDKDDSKYNTYFQWKGTGLVDTNAFFWCRLCMMAHEAELSSFNYGDIEQWWRKDTCVRGAWPGSKRSRGV
ncbi:hypothetical protein BOX15_Mlig026419g1 [Macrostomum lignano]|uniref:Fucosyltransferase n=2 Tax=Macrostomum lignano TaxID=282301 RepID=A0A1I8HEQ3_9PLAT|nr:hypothetical protein BOX15_Mlig026419g1 [Macrostomum lignano]